ncbi:uncharacterized protein [Littorina saxatilis]|uniref:Uncharacterized protein n=1 Tax=Littorina saxatilis TaxID=31220 RepID=A0AAN9BJN4_9CAEN
MFQKYGLAFVLLLPVVYRCAENSCVISETSITADGCNVTGHFKLSNSCFLAETRLKKFTVKDMKAPASNALLCVIDYSNGICQYQAGCTCDSVSQEIALTKQYDSYQYLEWEVSVYFGKKSISTTRLQKPEPCLQAREIGAVTTSDAVLSTQTTHQWNTTGITFTDRNEATETEKTTLLCLMLAGAVVCVLLLVIIPRVVWVTLKNKRRFRATNAQQHLPDVNYQPQQPTPQSESRSLTDTGSHSYEDIAIGAQV